jgi:hemolysin III
LATSAADIAMTSVSAASPATIAIDEGFPGPHYPSRAERAADASIHGAGLVLAGAGAAALLVMSLAKGGWGLEGATALYAGCMLATFICSAVYNLARTAATRLAWRRVDHAAIFLMIAGSYTPFTSLRLDPPWSIAATGAIWLIAIAAALGKLFLPGVSRRIWLVAYLALGWAGVAALQQMLDGVSRAALILIAIGGAIYTLGVAFYASTRLPFRRAIWHGLVLVAAGVHYAAVVVGVVYASARA